MSVGNELLADVGLSRIDFDGRADRVVERSRDALAVLLVGVGPAATASLLVFDRLVVGLHAVFDGPFHVGLFLVHRWLRRGAGLRLLGLVLVDHADSRVAVDRALAVAVHAPG